MERDPNWAKIKNLKQYKDMPDDEFDEVYEAIATRTSRSEELERRINKALDEFKEDYDISDLKMNDKLQLRSMLQSSIALEDYAQVAYRLQRDVLSDPSDANVSKLKQINLIMKDLVDQISKNQADLKIDRKARKGDKEESVINTIDDLKRRARTFHASRYVRVFCPKCKTLIGSMWALYPDNTNNKAWFYCKKCDNREIVSYKEIFDNGMKNIKGVPDF